MTASVSLWLKDILPHTPGVVRAVARRELILAAREFYRDSVAWRTVDEAVFWSADDSSYVVSPPDSNSEVTRVLSVEVNGVVLTPVVERPVGERTSGTPTLWYPMGAGAIEIWPTPDQYEDDIRARAALVPAASTSVFPDLAYALHYDALIDGVLGRLYAHPAKPYSNATLAEYHLKRFRMAIGAASGEVKQGGFAGQNWRFPPFAK